MRLCSIGGTELRMSPFFGLLLLIFTLLGAAKLMLLGMLSLSLHEAAHTMMARSLGYRISRVELQPFGFVARLSGELLSPWDELCVASAGPLFSLLVAVSLRAAPNYASTDLLRSLSDVNLSIALVNLLPALPMDGGRILKSALGSLLGMRKAALTGIIFSLIISLFCIGLGILLALKKTSHILPLIFGSFLLAAAVRERRMLSQCGIKALFMRSASLALGATLPVRHVLVSGDTAATAALASCGGAFTIFAVTDERMKVIGYLDESTLTEGMARLGSGAAIRSLLK